MRWFLALALLSVPAASQAQATGAWEPGHQKTADWLSTGADAAQIAADGVMAFRGADRSHALKCFAIRQAVAIGASEGQKRLFKQPRPAGSTASGYGMPSEHNVTAWASSGWSVSWGTTLGGAVAYLRPAANAHTWTQVGVGVLEGLGIRFGQRWWGC